MRRFSPALLSIWMILGIPEYAAAADDAKTLETSETIGTTVTVESVDVPNRLLTIRTESGDVQTIDVDPLVRNLPQLKKGDKISIKYTQAVAAEIKPPGTSGKQQMESTQNVQRSQPGARPGGTAERYVKATIKVKEVNPERHTLTFVGPRGVSRTITVKNPDARAYLKKLKPGDEVEVNYKEALVVSVDPARS